MSENKMKDVTYRSPDERLAEKKSKYTPKYIFLNGVLFENPALRLVLGTCPLLAVTISAKSSLFMGLAVLFVLTASEAIISLLRNIIPNKVRIPAFITIIATFVTIVQLLISAYFPALNESLGIYIPLIVVNCILLARAETFASKQPVMSSILDGFSMGVGFTLALLLMGSIREILGCGTFFDMQLPLFGTVFEPMMFFMLILRLRYLYLSGTADHEEAGEAQLRQRAFSVRNEQRQRLPVLPGMQSLQQEGGLMYD